MTSAGASIWLVTCVTSTAIIGLIIFGLGNFETVIHLGRERIEPAARARLNQQKLLLRNHNVAFWVMISVGILSFVIMISVLTVWVIGDSVSLGKKLTGTISGLGDCALFRFFYLVWKESAKQLREDE